MNIIGLTGSFGTGKTFCASVFRSLGAKVLDADRIARSVLAKGSTGYRKTVKLFGRAILGKDGEIDRAKLARRVFKNRKDLKLLNGIVHPEVTAHIKEKIKRSELKDSVIVIDAPLLIEAGLARLVDIVIVVTTSKEKQFLRCMKKFKMNEKECARRISSQIPLRKKIKMADFVIDNDGSRDQTRKQVMEIWRKVWR